MSRNSTVGFEEDPDGRVEAGGSLVTMDDKGGNEMLLVAKF